MLNDLAARAFSRTSMSDRSFNSIRAALQFGTASEDTMVPMVAGSGSHDASDDQHAPAKIRRAIRWEAHKRY